MPARIFIYLKPLLLTSVIAGGVLAILGPFGTSGFSLSSRLVYWIGLCAAGGLGAGAAELIFTKLSSRKSTLNRWVIALLQSLGATLVVSLFLFALHAPTSPGGFTLTLFYIWVVAIAISAIGALQKGHRENADNTPPVPPALASRLKPALRRTEIYALEAQDHYVRVITSEGDDLLMRLSDAIAEAAPLKGLSPHRSWWVAETGVKSVTRRGSKTVITLHNQTIVPVSRGRVKTLREANWA